MDEGKDEMIAKLEAEVKKQSDGYTRALTLLAKRNAEVNSLQQQNTELRFGIEQLTNQNEALREQMHQLIYGR